MPVLKALVFDLDDTLYDQSQFEKGGIEAIGRYVAERYGVPEVQACWLMDSVRRTVGKEAMLDELLRVFGLPAECIPELVRAYRYHAPDLNLFPRYGRLLARWHKKFRLALLTDGLPDVQRRKVSALALEPLMDVMLFTWDNGKEHGKPSPQGYRELLQRLDLAPTEMIYVGDNPAKDFVGARTLGIHTVRVLTGVHRHDEVRPGYGADLTISSVLELPGCLDASAADRDDDRGIPLTSCRTGLYA